MSRRPGVDSVVGFDGWRGGWVGVRLTRTGFHEAVAGEKLADLVAVSDVAIGVDMPLGFADGANPREFDLAARAGLGSRASTLFLVPSRDVMELDTYAAANQLSKERYGKGISKQVYNLRAKIFECIDLADRRMIEVHPELVFADIAGEPLPEPKKTWAGQRRRVALLESVGIRIPSDVGPAGTVPPDDLIDAAAVAHAAWNVARFGLP